MGNRQIANVRFWCSGRLPPAGIAMSFHGYKRTCGEVRQSVRFTPESGPSGLLYAFSATEFNLRR